MIGDMDKVIYRPIGIIHTAFRDKVEAPIQGVFARDAKGEVEVFPEYADGLKDLEGFSHIILACNNPAHICFLLFSVHIHSFSEHISTNYGYYNPNNQRTHQHQANKQSFTFHFCFIYYPKLVKCVPDG